MTSRSVPRMPSGGASPDRGGQNSTPERPVPDGADAPEPVQVIAADA